MGRKEGVEEMSEEMEEVKCIACEQSAIGNCEACEAPICEDHESGEHDDVYTCKDEDGCSLRIDAKNSPYCPGCGLYLGNRIEHVCESIQPSPEETKPQTDDQLAAQDRIAKEYGSTWDELCARVVQSPMCATDVLMDLASTEAERFKLADQLTEGFAEPIDMHAVARNVALHISNAPYFPVGSIRELHEFLYQALTTPFPFALKITQLNKAQKAGKL
jgi:hypothetical protein